MVELDALLSVIENPARRRILEALVREPHYPLQLSKELGMTQQAVIKHLKVLERAGRYDTAILACRDVLAAHPSSPQAPAAALPQLSEWTRAPRSNVGPYNSFKSSGRAR